MKYEAVFGNQDLFDGAGTFTGLDVVVHSISSGIKSYARLSDLTPESLRNHPVCAMRRIIKEPKRWTVEDQKAGLLPEVGCLVFGLNGRGECEVVASEKNELALRHVSTRNLMLVTVSAFNRNFKPIETPEEKAVRLRSEWVELVRDKALISADEYTTEAIYDSLLSGALSAPTKGSE